MSVSYSLCGKKISIFLPLPFSVGIYSIALSMCVCATLVYFTLTEIKDITIYQRLLLLAQMEVLLWGETRLPRGNPPV